MLRSPLLHFLVGGVLLLGLTNTQAPLSEMIVVEVMQSEIDQRIEAYRSQLGRAPSLRESAAIESQVIEDALWLEQARALDLQKTDLVVRQRLILNMQFLEDQKGVSEDALFEKAVALGMDQTDTVVRRRLIDRVQAMIRAGVRSRTIDESVLRAHYAATASRWREPPLFDLAHVYFSRDKRGDRARIDAQSLLLKLIAEDIDSEQAVGLADPFLSGHRLRAGTPNRILALFGPAFTTSVEDQPSQRWVGPIDSAFGAHLVWIHERVESRIPPFEEVQNRVREDWISEESRRALKAQIERRREIVEVQIVNDRQTRTSTANDPEKI